MLYEAALGFGISVGPRLGGELGAISWRGPFFGVAVLMTIALVATAVLLERTPAPPASERTQTEAAALLDAAMAELREAGVPVTGEIVHSTGTHAEVAARILDRAALLSAGLIVIGADTEHPALHGASRRTSSPTPRATSSSSIRGRAPSVARSRAWPRRPTPTASGTPPEQLRFLAPGEVPERLNGRDWKSRNGGYLVRGFESLPLRGGRTGADGDRVRWVFLSLSERVVHCVRSGR
jgi:nucleotide-binding universal stress UspA family protein